MNPLEVLWKLRFHVLQCKRGTDLHALRPSFPFSLTKIANHGAVVTWRIKTGNACRTGLQTLGTFRSEAPFFVHDHMEFLGVVVNHGRIDRTCLFALTLLGTTLAANVLDRFRGRKKISIDTNSRELAVDRPIVEHGARDLAKAASDAKIPSGLDQRLTLGIRDILHSPSFLVPQGFNVF
jgi:hypothetical protein